MAPNTKRVFYVNTLSADVYIDILAGRPDVQLDKLVNDSPEDEARAILTQAADHLTAQGTLVVEIGHHRSRLEQRYPRLPFFWPETSGGDDCVFVLKRADLVAPGALQVQPARRRAIS